MATQPSDCEAREQAALRRLATLVVRAAAPEEVFSAIAEEAGRLLGADHATMSRYVPDGEIRVVAAWSSTGAPSAVVTHWSIGGRNLHTLVFQTGRAVRIDDYANTTGPSADIAREIGVRAAVGVPVSVEGNLWGVIIVESGGDPLPTGTEARLARFTERAAMAIANAQARMELREFAEEQRALRRVATLVAQAAAPEEVFAAVAEESGRLLGVGRATIARYDPDGAMRVVAAWSTTDAALSVGSRWSLGGQDLPTQVFHTGRPARIDDFADASGPIPEVVRASGGRGAVGVPVSVEGRLWGVMIVGSTREQPLPADTETRLAGFTELAATAIANAQARMELRRFAEEQAALRRVATLVAQAAAPEKVFATIAEEAGLLLGADHAIMAGYDPDGSTTVVAAWSSTGPAAPVGHRATVGGHDLPTLVFQTRRPARIDDFAKVTGPSADIAYEIGIRAAVGVPVSVEGRLWGVMVVASTREPPPADTETRLAGFTELAATAIANAEAQAALTASRARIVATADATRRRIERDLHDGAQQRLVSLGLQLGKAQAAAPPGPCELRQELEGAVTEVNGALEELREIAHGLHPATLTERGLRAALTALARRSAVPVGLDVRVKGRLPEQIEIAAYYVVAEALTNAAKHAHATVAEVEVAVREGVLRVCVRDDGCGGADFGHSSGLVGLTDRVEALGGRLWLHSPPGAGTTLQVQLPVGQAGPREADGAGPGSAH